PVPTQIRSDLAVPYIKSFSQGENRDHGRSVFQSGNSIENHGKQKQTSAATRQSRSGCAYVDPRAGVECKQSWFYIQGRQSCRVTATKDRITSDQKKENMLAGIPVLARPRRAVGDFHRTAANVGLPYCPAYDGLALLGHVDGRESRAHKDCRHCTAAVLVLVHAQPHCYPWNGIVRPAIRHLVHRNPRPLSVGAMLHPRCG